MDNSIEQRNPVDVLGEQFMDQRRRGEAVSIEAYAAAHPELEEEIRHLFPAMIAMERFKACKLSSSGAPVEWQIEGLEQLGDYRIIREIGRGGMGVVYEAEQQSLGRRVAVKVFPRQTLSDSRQLKRFRREARTSASLHHTNIVPVFGVGQQDGLHYYVMQRIEGISLDELINESPDSSIGAKALDGPKAQLDETDQDSFASAGTSSGEISGIDRVSEFLSSRLATSEGDERIPPRSIANLVDHRTSQSRSHWNAVANVGIQVAEALAYAHAQGVLHRDIKPSNLLLDPQGKVWVTDFGLATLVDAEKLSNPGDIGGTLRFMAPEHIRGEQDARSDIYSLGLTLYELLTLRPAFEDQSRAQLVQKILAGRPPAPRTHRPEIPRDLEAVILKAIEREPGQRYDHASAMAADLLRFVEGRPVHARRINSIARTWRWTRRNPAVASLSAALLLVAFVSFVLVSAKWREAVAENRRAEDNLSLALESMDQMLERFASSWMAHPEATVSETGDAATPDFEVQMAVSNYSASVLQETLKFYDQFAKQNATNPQLRRDTAKVHRRVADIYQRLGQYAEAEQAYQRSLEILDSERIDDDGTLAIEKASVLNQLGLTMYATSRFKEAEAEFLRAKSILFNSNHKDDPECRAELARTNNNLGQALRLLRRHDEARQSHRQAVELLERLVQEHPQETDYRLALARAYRIYFPFVTFGRRPNDHRQIRAAGIAILEELVRDFPNVPDYQCELSEMLATTSFRPRGSESRDRQREQLERAVDLARELSGAHPSIPRYRAVLARSLKELAKTLDRSRREESNKIYAESVAIYRSLAQDFADIPTYRIFLAMTLQDHAENLQRMGRTADAIAALQEGVAEQEAYVELRPHNQFGDRTLARLREKLAEMPTAVNPVDEPVSNR